MHAFESAVTQTNRPSCEGPPSDVPLGAVPPPQPATARSRPRYAFTRSLNPSVTTASSVSRMSFAQRHDLSFSNQSESPLRQEGFCHFETPLSCRIEPSLRLPAGQVTLCSSKKCFRSMNRADHSVERQSATVDQSGV